MSHVTGTVQPVSPVLKIGAGFRAAYESEHLERQLRLYASTHGDQARHVAFHGRESAGE